MEPTVIRSSSPFEVLALAERTLGFRPRESLVVVSLRPPRWRSGLVVRADLADAATSLDLLADHLRVDGAGRGFVAVVTDEGDLPPLVGPAARALLPAQRTGRREEPGPDRLALLPGADVAHLATEALLARGVEPELWLVHRGRLHSYTCERPCCPAAGLPLSEVESTRVAAEMVLAGRGLAGDREEWEAAQLAAVAPADPAAVAEVAEQLELVDLQWRRWERDRAAAAGRGRGPFDPGAEPPVVALALWRGLLDPAWALPGAAGGAVAAVGPEVAAVLLGALGRLPVRDVLLGAVVPEAAGGAGAPEGPLDPDTAVEVLQHLARLAPPDRRAAALGCAAYVLWSRGAAAPAALLAELALADDPEHSLSGLVLQSARLGVAPPSVREARRAG